MSETQLLVCDDSRGRMGCTCPYLSYSTVTCDDALGGQNQRLARRMFFFPAKSPAREWGLSKRPCCGRSRTLIDCAMAFGTCAVQAKFTSLSQL